MNCKAHRQYHHDSLSHILTHARIPNPSRLSTRLINKLSVKGRQISDTRRRMAKAKNYYEW